jgi:beta-glucosidase
VADAPISDAQLDELLGRLDLEHKVLLLSGAGTFHSRAEPLLGLRSMSFSDGPVGVRGERWDESDTSVLLPSPTAMAATWDEELVARLGRVLAAEARRKRVDVLLAPTLNLQRSPLAGRHFEYFSEDALLTGRIGAAFIRGVQSGGVAATAKHYVANDSEDERMTLDARLDERTLREVYLAPFEQAVAAGVHVVMSAYNGVNGATMSENPLLEEPLKGEWGFAGMVVSDWGGVRSTVPAALAAQDLAMPGPNPVWGRPLGEALLSGAVPEAALDAKLRRILRLAAQVGALDGIEAPRTAVPAVPAAEDVRALLRSAVAASCVLLRNRDALLPLDPTQLRRVAVIGPNAAQARLQGGGSAGVFPATAIAPLDGVRAALSGIAEVEHAVGAYIETRPTPLSTANAVDPRSGEPGVLLRYLDAAGEELHAEHRYSGRVLEPTADNAREALRRTETMEICARLRVPSGGEWQLAVVGLGRVALEVDGKVLIDEVVEPESGDPAHVHVTPPFRRTTVLVSGAGELDVVARRSLDLESGLVLALCADAPRRGDEEELAAAVRLAGSADAAVVVVGTTDEIESEGFDRASLTLPGLQNRLVAEVVAANPRTVVVVNSGGPVELPWRDAAPALLLSWFPGQEAGDGLANLLFGGAEPVGRLPTTWAARIDDLPVRSTAPDDGVLEYREGLHVGYRAWLRAQTAPAFWFGEGLGYTEWAYEAVSAPEQVAGSEPFEIVVRVRNVGRRRGREVVQVYAAREHSELERPVRWLAGYRAVIAEPGQSVEAAVTIPPAALRHWSVADRRWRTEPGAFTLLAGRSAADLPLSAAVRVA